MQIDENDEFDDCVDPYDRRVDFEYDDGIADIPPDELDETDDADWDPKWEDEPAPKETASVIDEMADYDEIED